MTEEALSPSTQALLIAALLQHPWRKQWHPADGAASLRYTAMAWSRAVRQIVALGVATVQVEERVRGLRMDYSARETWERVRSKFRSPIKRTLWARLPPREKIFPFARLAGLSALAQHSVLAEPFMTTYALSATDWNAALAVGWVQHSGPDEGTSAIQLWSYSPAWVAGAEVDPLSLWLSLQPAEDERVEGALNELMETVPWSEN